MKKIVCPYCNHVMSTDSKEPAVYCEKCSKAINIEQGERLFNMLVMKYFNNAITELYGSTDYAKAANYYNKVLELEDREVDAVYGLALATLYLSTLRVSRLEESRQILEKYTHTLQSEEFNPSRRLDFVDAAIKGLDLYVSTLKNRLSKDDVFYEKEGLDLYQAALNDALKYKKLILDLFFQDDSFYPKKSAYSSSVIKNQIRDVEQLLEIKREVTLDEPKFVLSSQNAESHLVEDKVFKDHLVLYKKRNTFLIIMACFLVLAIIGVILIFTIPNYLVIGVSIGSVGLVGTLAGFIGNIVIKRKLYK